MAQDGLASFEPAFMEELPVMMRWAFKHMQRSGEQQPDERTWLCDATGGSVYLRLSTRSIEQPRREMTTTLRQDIINGAYWMRKPNAQIVVAYTGVMALEAIEAVGLMGEDRRDIGLLAITSADRLNAGSARPRGWADLRQ
jgi:pyruvate dehydrogenase E1 component